MKSSPDPDGKNRTPEVAEALRQAKDGDTLSFEAGRYDFWSDGAYEGYFCPSCNKSGDKKVIFPLLRLRGFVIDGGGAEFIFHDRVFPFIVQDCKDIVLKDFSVDFSFPRCMICTVGEVSDKGIGLLIDREKYDYSADCDGNFIIHAGNDDFSTCERRFFLKQGLRGNGSCCYLAAGKIFYENDSLPAGVLYCTARETSDGIFLEYNEETVLKPDFKEGDELLVSYDEQRDNDNFFFDRSEDISISDVRIFSGAGMGFIGQLCSNFTMKNCTISPRGDGYSTTADGILLTNFSGKVSIENCVIRNTMDDAISVHGYYTRTERITARNKAVLRMLHASQSLMNPYRPGDILTVTDGKPLNETCRLTIKSARYENDPYLIYAEFEEDIRGMLKPGDLLENPGRTPDTLIRGCLFENACSVRLGSAGKTVFEGNCMKNCAGLLINDIMRWWYASGPTRDVTISANRFNGCGISSFIDRGAPSDVRHRLIKITDNSFSDCDIAVNIRDTEKVVISGNTFKNVRTPIRTSNCLDIEEVQI